MPKILLIDDSTFMRQHVRGFLESGGFEVEEYLPASALEVMQKIKDSNPNLILSDFNMPNVDGQEVARMARRTNSAIPVVILTATRDAPKEAYLHTIGVRRVLHKPINGEELVKALKEVLSIA